MTRFPTAAFWTFAGLATLAAACAIAWQLQSAHTSTYTDGDRISVRASDAPLRSILWQPAIEVPGGINTGADEYEPRISADGARMIFVRGKPGANADLFESRWTPDGWSPPTPIAGINSSSDELGPELSRDGRTLYFYSDRPGGVGGFDLWRARTTDQGWQEPENLGPSINTEHNEYGPALNPDGDLLYFSSNRPRAGEPPRQRDAWPATVRESRDRHDYDLYRVARLVDAPAQPHPVAGLNTPFDEGSPCFSPAGDFLYFASDRPGGSGGFDLYRARMDRGEPAPPESLGPAVNSPANDLDPALSMDGFRLSFSSSRPSALLTPSDKPANTVDYGLWTTSSREVYLRSDAAAAREALLGLLQEIAPWLLLLLPLGLLFFALRDPRFRRGFGKLSLLAQCVLISLMIHAIVASLLAVWKVGSQIGEFLTEGGGNRVILASTGIADGVITQIRGDLADATFTTAMFTESRADLIPALPQIDIAPTNAPEDPSWRDSASLPESLTPTPPPASQPILSAPPPQLPSDDPRTPHDIAPSPGTSERSIKTPAAQPPPDAMMPPLATQLSAAQVSVLPLSRGSSAPDTASFDQALLASPSPSPSSTPAAPDAAAPSHIPAADTRTPQDAALGVALTEATPVTPTASLSYDQAPTTLQASVAAPRIQVAPSPAQGGAPSDTARLDLTASPAALSSPDAKPLPPRTLVPPLSAGERVTAIPTAVAPAQATAEGSTQSPPAEFKFPEDRASVPGGGLTRDTRADVPILISSSGSPYSAAPASNLGTSTSSQPSTPRVPAVPFSVASSPALPAAALPKELAPAPAAPDARDAASTPTSPISDTPRPAVAAGPASKPVTAPTHLQPAGISSEPGPSDQTRLSLSPSMDGTTPVSTPFIRTLPKAASAPADAGTTARLPTQEPEPQPLDTFTQRAPESRGELLERMGGSAETEKAVGLALDWLRTHQSPDGRWSGRNFDDGHEPSGGPAEIDSDAAMTGLSLLCFLGAGHTHTADGPYRASVQRALDWLIARQAPDGDLRRDPSRPQAPSETMYSHNIATVALCEAFAMTRDPKLTQAARRAVAFMVSIQASHDPRRQGARAKAEDTSVIGWQVMAMHSARRSGFTVPQSAFDSASAWLDRVASPSAPGHYAYQRGGRPIAAMTAEAMFVRQLLGNPRTQARMAESARFVLDTPPRWENGAPTHYWYYATLALFQHQGDEWREWNDQLVPQLLRHQHQTGPAKGTWDPQDEWSRLGGRIYQTAVCTLSLEVYYRYNAANELPQPGPNP